MVAGEVRRASGQGSGGYQARTRGELRVHSIGVSQSKSLKLVGRVDGLVVILSGVMLGPTQPACGADEWQAAAQEGRRRLAGSAASSW